MIYSGIMSIFVDPVLLLDALSSPMRFTHV
jgi:hypothetical protein